MEAIFARPTRSSTSASMNFEVRTTGLPGTLIPAIRKSVRRVNPNLTPIDVKTQNEQVKRILAADSV